MRLAAEVSEGHPVLIDRYLKDAVEIDLDCIADGKTAVVAGILQHIEEAGIHSGDSAAVLPPGVCRRRSSTKCAASPADWRCDLASSA